MSGANRLPGEPVVWDRKVDRFNKCLQLLRGRVWNVRSKRAAWTIAHAAAVSISPRLVVKRYTITSSCAGDIAQMHSVCNVLQCTTSSPLRQVQENGEGVWGLVVVGDWCLGGTVVARAAAV